MTAAPTLAITNMSKEHQEFLKKEFCPPGCTDIAFQFFLAFCQRTGLDPLLKQAFLVERKSRGPNDEWITKYEPMASEAGMAARADLQPDCKGMSGGAVFEGDVFKINPATHQVTHETEPLKRGKLVGAWAQAHREGRMQPPTFLRLEERIQMRAVWEKGKKIGEEPTRFWNIMGPGMILKCARAEQWRQAWPNLFNGVYIPEELPDEEAEAKPTVRDTIQAPDLAKPALQRETPEQTIATPDVGMKVPVTEAKPPVAETKSAPAAPAATPPGGVKYESPEEAQIDQVLKSAAKKSDCPSAVKLITGMKNPERQAYWRARYTARVAELPQ
jgi:phage recombination protein Bet